MRCECKYVRLTVLTQYKHGDAVVCGYQERDSSDWNNFVNPAVWWETEEFHQDVPLQKEERTQGGFGVHDNTDGFFEGCEAPEVVVFPDEGDGDNHYEYSGSSLSLSSVLGDVESFAIEESEQESEGISYLPALNDDWGNAQDWYKLRAGPIDTFQLGANHGHSSGGTVSYASTKVRFRRQFAPVPVEFRYTFQHYNDFAASIPSGDPETGSIIIPIDQEYSEVFNVKVDHLSFPNAVVAIFTLSIYVPAINEG